LCQTSEPSKPISSYVEPVVDSSRYFVVRFVDDKSNRQAYLGLGFKERDDALAFTDVLNSYARDVKREREISEKMASGVVDDVMDLSLKDGEKMSISIAGEASERRKEELKTRCCSALQAGGPV